MDAVAVFLGDIIMAIRTVGWLEPLRMRDLLDIAVAVDAVPVAVYGFGKDFGVHMKGDFFPIDHLRPAWIVVAIEAALIAQVFLGTSKEW